MCIFLRFSAQASDIIYDHNTDADCGTKCYRCCCCKCNVTAVIRKQRIAVTKVEGCCKETQDNMDMDFVEDMCVAYCHTMHGVMQN